jgi:hypothetical protein
MCVFSDVLFHLFEVYGAFIEYRGCSFSYTDKIDLYTCMDVNKIRSV